MVFTPVPEWLLICLVLQLESSLISTQLLRWKGFELHLVISNINGYSWIPNCPSNHFHLFFRPNLDDIYSVFGAQLPDIFFYWDISKDKHETPWREIWNIFQFSDLASRSMWEAPKITQTKSKPTCDLVVSLHMFWCNLSPDKCQAGVALRELVAFRSK